MTTIRIDDKEYAIDALSQEARNQLASLQFVDNEWTKPQAQMAALETARMAYAKALQESLQNPEGDTINLWKREGGL